MQFAIAVVNLNMIEKMLAFFKEYYELGMYGHNTISRKATNKEIKEGNGLVYYVNCPECGKNNRVKDGD